MKSHQVRQSFIDYFKKQNHAAIASSSLIPEDDPTLLFANAGMNQFKNTFLGLEKRNYSRAVTSQKCVRAGGKHNDLENVGFTARHHTFFEMLGNFSFGDYFKKDAIHFAWEYLTKDLGLDKNKLYVTVFETDDDAADIWHKQEGVPRERIFRFGEKDNFWRMGDTGPCGPCSEIFFDRGEQYGKEKDPFKSIASGEDRIIEIWNLVFMQFFEKAPGQLEPLPKPSVDTGAGLERVVSVVQNQLNNYDTDLFAPMIQTAMKVSGKEYVNNRDLLMKNASLAEQTAAFRVLADHCRASGFLIADGAMPANEGRGYVLRRIMRRAIRYGRKLSDKSLLVPMVDSLVGHMGDVYPELKSRRDFILSTVKDEETRFLQTLDTGAEILENEIRNLKAKNLKKMPGEITFKMYDTYGFPVDLTRLIANEKNIEVDESEFDTYLNEAKTKSKASWKGKSLDSDQAHLIQWSNEIGQKGSKTVFKGYETLSDDVNVIALSNGHRAVDKLNTGDSGFVILNLTPFYAESGGQIGDQGILEASGVKINVVNTTKSSDMFLHEIFVEKGTLSTGVALKATVDTKARKLTASNHSATHLMHAALRKILGETVTQAGSLVDAQKLRFDYTFNRPLAPEEISKIEDMVNDQIYRGDVVSTHQMNYKKALEFGALALFGEKYGDDVRVLKMGDFSCELCGGTHVSNTAEIRLFKIVSETGVSSGVRRIEALTNKNALDYLNKIQKESQMAKASASLFEKWDSYLESTQFELPTWIEARKNEIKDLEKQIRKLKSGAVDIESTIAAAQTTEKSVPFVAQIFPIDDREALADIADKLKNKLQKGIVIVIGKEQNSFPVIVSVSKDLANQVKAGDVVKFLAQKYGGKGGGRPDFAQGSMTQEPTLDELNRTLKTQF
ncbi:MAG: alanine--tRNA ligase [Bdellovibrionaceae bacterium]|nr:alanine--tRNA ligase [Pseudobdellovibrionaceae bacterium]